MNDFSFSKDRTRKLMFYLVIFVLLYMGFAALYTYSVLPYVVIVILLIFLIHRLFDRYRNRRTLRKFLRSDKKPLRLVVRHAIVGDMIYVKILNRTFSFRLNDESLQSMFFDDITRYVTYVMTEEKEPGYKYFTEMVAYFNAVYGLSPNDVMAICKRNIIHSFDSIIDSDVLSRINEPDKVASIIIQNTNSRFVNKYDLPALDPGWINREVKGLIHGSRVIQNEGIEAML